MDAGLLYDKIYNITNAQMKKNEMQLSFSKNAYESILYQNPNEVSVFEFMDLSSKDFIDSVYLRCLNRLPDVVAYKHLDNIKSGRKRDIDYWKYFVLLTVSESQEFKNTNKRLLGFNQLKKELIKNGTIKSKIVLKQEEVKVIGRNLVKKYCLLPVWRRLPEKTKNKLRRIILKEK